MEDDDDFVFIPAVRCHGYGIPGIPTCGEVELTHEEYMFQMRNPNYGWTCPMCGASADWDGNE